MRFRQLMMLTGFLLISLAGFAWAQGSASISGTVTDAETGAGIAEASVSAFSVTGDSSFYFAQSDANGNYTIDNVNAGTYFFSVDAPGYLPSFRDTLAVSANSQNTLNFQLSAETGGGNGEISGLTSDATTGLPLANVVVRLYGPEVYELVSDSGGFYSGTNLMEGPYLVEASAAGYQLYFSNFPVDIIAGNPVNLDIALFPGDSTGVGDAVLFGTVNAENGDVIAGATIFAAGFNSPVGGDSLIYFTTSNENGDFEITQMVSGSYLVVCEAPGFVTERLFNVNVSDTTTINFVLSDDSTGGGGSASLEGFVFDAVLGVPIDNATVTLEGGPDSSGVSILITAVTYPGGIFSAQGIPAGTYTITCSAFGYTNGVVENFLIEPNSHQFIEFALERGPITDGGVITGEITFDGSGWPVEGVFVEFIGENASIWGHYTYTDSSGFYYGFVPPGNYIVSINYVDPATWYPYVEYYDDVLSIAEATQISVAEGDSITGINFGVPDSLPGGNFTLSGNVSDENGNPLDDALVTLRSFDNVFGAMDSVIYGAYTDSDGNYTIEINELLYPFNLYVAMAEKEGFDAEFWLEKSSMYEADPIPIYTGGVMEDVNFTLGVSGSGGNLSINGQVYDEITGAPLSGAFVVGSNVNTGQIAFAFSGTQGEYVLNGLENAPHVILFAANGYVPEFYDNAWLWEDATAVNPTAAGASAIASLTPFDPDTTRGNIAGTVKDFQGNVISGVLLTIADSDGNVIGYDFSDAMGSYSIPGMNSGDYTVQASKLEWMSETTDVAYALSSPTMLIDFNLSQAVTSIEGDTNEESIIPEVLELADNFPNPFNPSTTIKIAIPETGAVKLTVFNILGQPVKTLYDGQIAAGNHSFQWDGTGNAGQSVTTGIYFYTLEAAGQRLVKKMLFSK